MLRDLPNSQKPRERLFAKGVSVLSDVELVQIIVGSGVKGIPIDKLSEEIINKCLYKIDIVGLQAQELLQIKGLGKAKVAVILASIELGLRLVSFKKDPKTYIKTPKDVFDLLKIKYINKTQETLYLLSLDSRNGLVAIDQIGIGSISSIHISPREILAMALKRSAVSIIISHNHPSGDPTPSQEDLDVTEKIIEACSYMDICFIDHVVVGEGEYSSIKASGLIASNKFK
jgi:DNA repair protein RadC